MRTLSETELKVLAACHLRRDESLAAVSRDVPISVATLRKTLDRLEADLIIRPWLILPASAFELEHYSVLIKLSAAGLCNAAALAVRLQSEPAIRRVFEVTGAFDLELRVLARGEEDLLEVLNGCDAEGLWFKEWTVSRVIWNKYLQRVPPGQAVTYRNVVAMSETVPLKLSESDIRLLIVLSNAPEATLDQLSSAVGMPRSTVSYQLCRLKSQGAFCRTIGVSQRLPEIQSARIFLRLRRIPTWPAGVIWRYLYDSPCVMRVSALSGYWTVELAIEADRPKSFIEWWRNFRERFAVAILDHAILWVHEALRPGDNSSGVSALLVQVNRKRDDPTNTMSYLGQL